MIVSLFIHQLKRFCKSPIKLLITLLLPFALTWFLTDFFQETQEGLAIPVAIVDEDQTETSTLVIERLQSLPEIQVFELGHEEAERKLLQREIDSIFVLTEGLKDQLKAEKRDGTVIVKSSSSSFGYGIVQELLASELTRISSNMKAANIVVKYYGSLKPEMDANEVWKEAYQHSDSYWDPEPLMGIEYELYDVNGGNIENDQTGSTIHFWSIWSFVTLLMIVTSFQWLLVAKDRSIQSRMMTTSGGTRSYLVGVGGAHLAIHMLQGVIAVILYAYVNDTDPANYGWVTWFIWIAFTIGLTLALLFKNKATYYLTAFSIGCLLSVLGGSLFPVAELYQPLEKVAMVSPVTSFLQGTKEALWIWTAIGIVITLGAIRKSGGRID
ncbi:hypothetical protein GCM10008967_08010 [Bacillus carboniphilus]|uniref:ABC-2 type transporter transmembrane domain-containing protein n=1 Tax=Bacillus carboniphilus TaxID=86663 RepID=A0ABN0VXZ1_9BACI